MLQRELRTDPSKLNLTYLEMKQLDVISIDRVPEKIGIILKHSEYLVTSQRYKTSVRRRYNDFLALHELLLARFPYRYICIYTEIWRWNIIICKMFLYWFEYYFRLIPRLPPKKIIVSEDAHFLEARRKGLLRWLTLMARHPIVSRDPLVSYFLRDQGQDVQHRIRELFRRAPDEFMTSELSSRAKVIIFTITKIIEFRVLWCFGRL